MRTLVNTNNLITLLYYQGGAIYDAFPLIKKYIKELPSVYGDDKEHYILIQDVLDSLTELRTMCEASKDIGIGVIRGIEDTTNLIEQTRDLYYDADEIKSNE